MKKWAFFLGLSLICMSLHASVKLTGTIGKYKIAMELVPSTASKDFNVRGRYNYEGKTQSLDLKGNVFGENILQLTESFQGKETGDFYLESTGEGDLEGKWVANGKYHEVSIAIQSGDFNELVPYHISDYQAKVSSAITGSYVSETYYINDYFFAEDNPSVEVGFGGGTVTLKEMGKDKLQFSFNLICGPTYHFAMGGGTAIKAGPGEYLYSEILSEDDGACELKLIVKNKELEIKQLSSGMACGFGVRAYADGNFVKVNNVAVSAGDDEELTVSKALGR